MKIKILLISVLLSACLLGKPAKLSAVGLDSTTLFCATGVAATVGSVYWLYQKLNTYFNSKYFAQEQENFRANFALLWLQAKKPAPSTLYLLYLACDKNIGRMALMITSNYLQRPAS